MKSLPTPAVRRRLSLLSGFTDPVGCLTRGPKAGLVAGVQFADFTGRSMIRLRGNRPRIDCSC